MKAFSSFLFGSVFLIAGTGTLSAAPVCNAGSRMQYCSKTAQKDTEPNQEEKANRRFLRRQHTREAYHHEDMTPTAYSPDDCPRYQRGKRMTPDERMRLRQQIDEVGQAIYHR